MSITRMQIQLGNNVYGDAVIPVGRFMTENPLPSADRTIITHEVPMSTIWPQKDLGPKPPVIEGTIFLPEDEVATFISDLANDYERQFHWWFGGREVYVYVRTGTCTEQRYGEGFASRKILVSFHFQAVQTQVRDMNGSTLWGG